MYGVDASLVTVREPKRLRLRILSIIGRTSHTRTTDQRLSRQALLSGRIISALAGLEALLALSWVMSNLVDTARTPLRRCRNPAAIRTAYESFWRIWIPIQVIPFCSVNRRQRQQPSVKD